MKSLVSFHLNDTVEGVELSEFVKSPENVVIKAGWIRQTSEDFHLHPLPPFQLPQGSFTQNDLRTSPQDYLDGGIFYSTIYISPKATSQNRDLTEDERIKQSTSGLKALRQELVNIYSKGFSEVQSPDKSNNEHIFIQHYSCEGHLTKECKVTVYRVPNDILFFANARERPRLQGPKHSFGSGLLVIQRIDYSIAKNKLQNKSLSLEMIERTWTRGQTKILELGSLVQL